ncbi:unnamed protein product [Amoebophrya sp. A120]|nr:unnamed protein product [Amoebophrya sp. A120]|eukprot:GSA120T00017228001.1
MRMLPPHPDQHDSLSRTASRSVSITGSGDLSSEAAQQGGAAHLQLLQQESSVINGGPVYGCDITCSCPPPPSVTRYAFFRGFPSIRYRPDTTNDDEKKVPSESLELNRVYVSAAGVSLSRACASAMAPGGDADRACSEYCNNYSYELSNCRVS